MPAGWENSGWGVVTGSPLFGFVTAQVGNIYADPCQWESVPPFGPTVDDLVAAWANVPGFDATATTDVTVDGYAGKQIEFTVPNFNEDQCKDGRYGIWQEAIATGDGGPNYWAQGPKSAQPSVDPRRRRHPARDPRVRTSRIPRHRTEPSSTRCWPRSRSVEPCRPDPDDPCAVPEVRRSAAAPRVSLRPG